MSKNSGVSDFREKLYPFHRQQNELFLKFKVVWCWEKSDSEIEVGSSFIFLHGLECAT